MKNTNRALFSSVVALILCCSMLVGSTFAWFTDEVKSGVNQIVAGNLDVELYHQDKAGSGKVDTTTKLFDDVAKWEPGAVTYENLTVVNEGNLALKYELEINFTNAVDNGNGKTLADVLQVGVVPNGIKAGASREEVVAAVKTWKPMKSFIESGELLKQNDSYAYGIVIWWQPGEKDNEFNMNNENQGKTLSIKLGVNLHAWQKDAEKDSFDETYDAVVHSEAQLLAALEEGINNSNINVILGGNIQLTGTWTPVGDKDKGEYFTGTLDGKGYTISGLNVEANDYDALISAAKDATIKNLTVEGIVNGVNAAGIVARVEGNTVIENCVSKVAVTGTTKAGGIVSNVTGANAKIINCVNNADVSCSRAAAGGVGGIIGYVNGDAHVEVINCTNNGDVTGTQDQTTGAVVGNAGGNSSGLIAGFANTGAITGKNFVGDGLNRWLEDSSGLVLAGYCATPTNWTVAATVANATELVDALTNGGNVILFEDIALGENDSIVIPAGVTATLDLNGHTIRQEKTQTGAYALIDNKGTLTINDSVGTGKISYADIGTGGEYASNTISNKGTLNVNGGTIENTSSDAVKSAGYPHAIDCYQGSVTNITGGTVKSVNYDSIRMFCNSETLATTVNISGGTIVNRVTFQDPAASRAGYGRLNITGGTFITTEGITSNVRLLNFSNVGGNMKAVVTGGTFDKGFQTRDYVNAGVKTSDWLTYNGGIPVGNAAELQGALDNAENGAVIKLLGDITGNVTVSQKPGVKLTIDGCDHVYAGVILVDGKSATYTTAGVTIQNVKFVADTIDEDACIQLGNGDNDTRYTCNVTVSNCTFDVAGKVGVKSYTGGDKNLTITGCTATANAHSLIQAKGIDGILIEKCNVYSKNGMNFNNSDNVTITGCTVDVKGYAVRFGESSGGVGAAETYKITGCTLKSECNDGDAVIVLRGTADYATLTIENTTITGSLEITNTATGATVVK